MKDTHDQAIRELEEAQAYIARLRAPLLHYFGTTDPELLAEVWADRATSSSSTPLSETPKDSRDGDVRNDIDAMSRSAAASFLAFEDALPSLAPLSEPTREGT